MHIRVLTTGGTIDDLEYDSANQNPQSHESLVPGLMKQAKVTEKYTIEAIIAKDSKFVTDEDRELITKKCSEAGEDKIIISHGTMTMPETATVLGKLNLNKTIVLFGAAVPANKEGSDALFNLGSAFTAVQTLSPGVYVCMNGKIFPWDNVKKNFGEGVFETEN